MPSSASAFAVKSKSCWMASFSFLLNVRKFGALGAAPARAGLLGEMSRRPSAQGQLHHRDGQRQEEREGQQQRGTQKITSCSCEMPSPKHELKSPIQEAMGK